MSRDILVAYPDVTVKRTIGNESIVNERRSTVVVKLESGSIPEEAVFRIAESTCSELDNFSKARGLQIAEARLGHEECSHTFSLAEAETFIGTEEDARSIVSLPVSNNALPFGIVNRLRMLVPR